MRVTVSRVILLLSAVALGLAPSRGAFLRTATATFVATPVSAKTWVSGKNPDGPPPAGETKGTKRDYNYLQCLSGCLAVCQKPVAGAPEKDRATCLNECRDQCCATYECVDQRRRNPRLGSALTTFRDSAIAASAYTRRIRPGAVSPLS